MGKITDGRTIRLFSCTQQAVFGLVQIVLALILMKRTSSNVDCWIGGIIGSLNFCTSLFLISQKGVHIYAEPTNSIIYTLCGSIFLNILAIVTVLYNEHDYASSDLSKHLLFASSQSKDHAFAVFAYLTVYITCSLLIGLATYFLIDVFDPHAPFVAPQTTCSGASETPEDFGLDITVQKDPRVLDDIQVSPSVTPNNSSSTRPSILDNVGYSDIDEEDWPSAVNEDITSVCGSRLPTSPTVPNESAVTMTPSIIQQKPIRQRGDGFTNRMPTGGNPSETSRSTDYYVTITDDTNLNGSDLSNKPGRKTSIVREKTMTIIEKFEERSVSGQNCGASDVAKTRKPSMGSKYPGKSSQKPCIVTTTRHSETIEETSKPSQTSEQPTGRSVLNDIRGFDTTVLRPSGRRPSHARS